MSKEIISAGSNFEIEWHDRSYGGAVRTVVKASGADGSWTAGDLTIDKLGKVTIAGTPLTGGSITADTTVAANKKIILAAGTGGIDGVLATGAFRFGAATATVGFYGVAAVSRPSAYTQTYATALKTVAAATTHVITDSSGGTPSTTTLAAIVGGGGACENTTKNAIATLAAELALANADIVALKKVVNALIDDLQALGLVQ